MESGVAFVDEEHVKYLLDYSFIHVPIEPAGSFMTIYRFGFSNWDLNCTADSSNFACKVQVANVMASFQTLRQVSSVYC